MIVTAGMLWFYALIIWLSSRFLVGYFLNVIDILEPELLGMEWNVPLKREIARDRRPVLMWLVDRLLDLSNNAKMAVVSWWILIVFVFILSA